MLERLQLDLLSRPADALYRETTFVSELVLDPPYQRASVWTYEQKRNLIKSLLQGLPIGSIFLNHRPPRDPRNGPWEIAVVDGKQRIEALREFYENGFWIPGDWVGDDRALLYEDLPNRARFTIQNSVVSCYETKLPTIEDEVDLYNRINYGGTAHELTNGPH